MAEKDVCSHVRVVVRVRPASARELDGNFKNVVQVVDSHMLVFDPKEEEVPFFVAPRLRNRDICKKANKDLKFVFDSVFAEDSSQHDVFENSTKGILDGVLNGYNCTVFAYGATGAGKTHTMLGSDKDPGVMYLTMKELFRRIDEVKHEKVFDVAFSYLEVYNEQIRDLLANSGPLAVREDSTKGVVVQGLTLHQPKSTEHILEALDCGNRNRTQHPTDVNSSSSRSHAVFQIYLRQQDKTASLNPNVRVAKMSLIDLAGSERASATNAKGARFREGANINRSLLALGNVINTLANPKSKNAHIPYRDSKLTRLLKDSLGGNCRTIMIANVSPSSLSYEDTYNTLKYANRAKEIKSSLKSNVVSLDSHISQYAVICEKQRAEIAMLKQKLKDCEEKIMVASAPPLSSLTTRKEEYKKMAESLQSVFSSRLQIRQKFLVLERQLKENELRQRLREECHQQAQLLCGGDKAEKATCKHKRRLASLLTHQHHIKSQLVEVKGRFLENDGWLHRVENEIKLLGEDGQAPRDLQKDLQCHKLQLQVEDLKQHIEHMTILISLQDQEHRQTQKLVNTLLPAFRRQYHALKASGLGTPVDSDEYQAVEQLVLRERAVAWADQSEEAPLEAMASQQELSSLLSFSHLVYHQSTPCSGEKHKRRVSCIQLPPPLLPTGAGGNENRHAVTEDLPLKKPIRRKLAVSPEPSECTALAPPLCTLGLQETLSQEGVFPLQFTPEICSQPASHNTATNDDPNITFDVLDDAGSNTTIIISSGNSNQQDMADHGGSRPFRRLDIPLLDEKHAKPSYMAMTSAAERKRKFGGHGGSSVREPLKDGSQGSCTSKRMKPDSGLISGPLRVPRFRGSENLRPGRKMIRSISEGHLELIGVQKPKNSFLKTSQLFKKVAKRR